MHSVKRPRCRVGCPLEPGTGHLRRMGRVARRDARLAYAPPRWAQPTTRPSRASSRRDRCPSPSACGHCSRRRTRATAASTRAASPTCTRRSPPPTREPSGSASWASPAPSHAVGDADAPFTIMSVVEAVRVRARVRGARRRRRRERRSASTRPGCRSTPLEAVERTATGAPTRWSTPARSRRRASCPGATPSERWRCIHDGPLRASPAASSRSTSEVLRLGARRRTTATASSSPRCCAPRERSAATPGEAVDLYTRQCCARRDRARPRGDGRDARRRRRQPADRRAGRRPGRPAATRSR